MEVAHEPHNAIELLPVIDNTSPTSTSSTTNTNNTFTNTTTITATTTTTSSSSSHKERHTSHGDLVRDTIIGFADGLTVPFALTAGLSSLGSARLVILGGLAELFSGALSMGLGAYLAATTEAKRYEVEEARERREVREKPLDEEEEIYEIMAEYGLSREAVRGVVEELKRCPEQWVNVSCLLLVLIYIFESKVWGGEGGE